MAETALLGRIGTVIREVRGGKLPGEIRVVDAGEPVLVMAYCATAVAVGDRVRVVGSRGARQVDVAPWP